MMSQLETVAITLEDLLEDHVIDRLCIFIINVITCQDDMLNLEEEQFNTPKTYFNAVKPYLTHDQILYLALADLFLMVHGDDFFLFRKRDYFHRLHEISDAYFLWLCHHQLTHLFFHEAAMPIHISHDLDLTPTKKSQHTSIRSTSVAILKSISPNAQSSYQQVDGQMEEDESITISRGSFHKMKELLTHQTIHSEYSQPSEAMTNKHADEMKEVVRHQIANSGYSQPNEAMMNKQLDDMILTVSQNQKSNRSSSNDIPALHEGKLCLWLWAYFNLSCFLGHKKQSKAEDNQVELSVSIEANQPLKCQLRGRALFPKEASLVCDISNNTHPRGGQQEMPASVKIIRRVYFENPLRLTMHDWYLSAKLGLWGHDVHQGVFRMTEHASNQRRRAKIDYACKVVSKLNLFKFDPSKSLALKGVCK